MTDQLSPRPEWMASALCAQSLPDLWFPEGSGSSARIAKAICRECPVSIQCLDYAITNGEMWGVWAGTTERQRRDIIARARAEARTCSECETPLTGARRVYCSDECYDAGHRRVVARSNQRRRGAA